MNTSKNRAQNVVILK